MLFERGHLVDQKNAPRKADKLRHRVEVEPGAKLFRHKGEIIDNRRNPEKNLQNHLPDMREVVEARVEAGQNQRNAGGEKQQKQQIGQKKQAGPAGQQAGAEVKNGENEQIEQQRDQAGEGGGIDQRLAGKVDFCDQLALAGQAVHAGHGGLGEKSPEHDAEQQIDGIILHGAPQKDRKDQVDDAKKHQGLEQRPEIAQQRGFVAQFKFAPHQLGDDLQVARQGCVCLRQGNGGLTIFAHQVDGVGGMAEINSVLFKQFQHGNHWQFLAWPFWGDCAFVIHLFSILTVLL